MIVTVASLLLPAVVQAASDNLATLSLQKVAQRDKSDRAIAGGVLVGTGALIAMTDSGSEGSLAAGGLLAGLGGLVFVLKNPSEREYAEVLKVESPEERELMAYESLQYLADQQKRSRLTAAIANGALAVYCLSADTGYNEYGESDDAYLTYSALLYGGLGLYLLLVPSYQEQVYQDVKTAKERQYQLSLQTSADAIGIRVARRF